LGSWEFALMGWGNQYVDYNISVQGKPTPVSEVRLMVAEKMRTETNTFHIARTLGIAEKVVRDMVDKLDLEESNRIAANPGAARGRYRRIYEMIIEETVSKTRQEYVVRDRKGEKILDENGQEQKRFRKLKPSDKKILMKAVDQLCDLDEGVRAPTKTVSDNRHVHAIVSTDQQEALIHDSEYRALILAAEERERFILAQRSGHVASPVWSQSGQHPRRALDMATPPGPDEQYAHGPAGGETDQAPDDGAPSNREKSVLEQAGPGLHPRVPTELEDHLG
jgi:hypothetical protein